MFLAPLSTFNEKLAEDPSVNRLVSINENIRAIGTLDLIFIQQDTYQLWRTICANKILSSIPFILFMNKYDVLVAKLGSGVRFSDYVKKFKDDPENPNNPEKVAKCA